jgi:hypothetical protein
MMPHWCAASNISAAPTSSAMARAARTGCGQRLSDPPSVMIFGRTFNASARNPSRSTV